MTKANESAFPCPMGGDWPECDRGITTREYFAAMAMQGLLGAAWHPEMGVSPFATPECMAAVAIAHADALVAKLNKPAEAKS